MSSLPSPLSLGPAVQVADLPTRPVLPPMRTNNQRPSPQVAVAPPATNNLWVTTTPAAPWARHVNMLAVNMRDRPADMRRNDKVIAVGAVDAQALHELVSYLQIQLSNQYGTEVRAIRDDAMQPPRSLTAIQLMQAKISQWDKLYFLATHTPPLVGPADAAPQSPASFHECCIYVISLSPLLSVMQTMQPADLPEHFNLEQRYRWLVDQWRGQYKPDVMINVHNNDMAFAREEVVRIDGGIRALILNRQEGGVNYTSKQLRRVLFEVAEWLVMN